MYQQATNESQFSIPITTQIALDRIRRERERRQNKDARILPFADYLPSVLPRAWDARAKHIQLICEHLDAVTRGEIDRLAIFMPPRHAKTETVTVRYPMYRLEQNPQCRVLVTGYNEQFARKLGRKTRRLARERINLSQEQTSQDEWETIEGGGLMARGVGSPPTGSGFDLICIDDPIRKRQDAESESYREATWDWYTDDLYTRLEPNGAIIMTLTRWHHDDIAGRALLSEPSKWTVLKLPALAEADDPLGRGLGEALWPKRWPAEYLKRVRDVQTDDVEGAYAFEALYQQNPTPAQGAFFKVDQLNFLDARPTHLTRVVRAWDLAASADGNRTAGVLIGIDAARRIYILDCVCGQWLPDEKLARIRLTAELDGPGVAVRLPQDPGQAGVDQALHLTRLLAGFNVRTARVTGSKEVRAQGLAAQINAGNVTLVRGSWNKMFIEEYRQFPLGKNNDQVDAGADAFNEVAQSGWNVSVFRV